MLKRTRDSWPPVGDESLESALRGESNSQVAKEFVAACEHIAELEAALKKYGTHQPGCNWNETNQRDDCDCGFTEAQRLHTTNPGD